MRLEETNQKIIDIVKEYEGKGGITKSEACRILMNKFGGSRSTYWKSFDYLLSDEGGNKIEAKIIPPNKQQQTLFPTDSAKKLADFKKKILAVNILLDLIEKYPLIGDCYTEIKNCPTHFSKRFIPYFHREAEVIRIDVTSEQYSDAYTLEARHDILEKLPAFLHDYISDSRTELDSVKAECLSLCNDVISRSVSMLQKNYSESPFLSNEFYNNIESNLHVWYSCGQKIPGIESDFLRSICRYYFLVSVEFAPKFKPDSSPQQRTISAFVRIFYPRKKLQIQREGLYDYDYLSMHQLNTANIPPPPLNLPGVIEEIEASLGQKFMAGFYDDDYNDPTGIAEYYLNWLISLKIFSVIELDVMRIIFFRATVQKKLEGESYSGNLKRF